MAKANLPISGGKILILGLTFKENCPDIRNSKVVDVINELLTFGAKVEVYDPHADAAEVKHEYNLTLTSDLSQRYHAIVLAVSHKEFASIELEKLKEKNAIVYDIKGFLPKSSVTARL
jgi:UDP-N-acetyl-D-galactosamine dehydrogenase